MSREAVAVVVQRYGADVTGGSESLARAVAERLAGDYDVTVFTTRARDYVTWRNELPEGEETLAGVTVRRFSAVRERELQSFNALSDALFDKPHTQQQELDWLARQGPEVPALIEALKAEQQRWSTVVRESNVKLD